MKERQMEPSWRLMMTEGDIYRKHNHYHAAVDCYNKVLASPEVKDDLDLHIRVLRGLMNCHDMLMDDILLMDDLYQLHKYGEKSDNECYKALANFVMGKRQCLHGSKQNGFSLCLDALEVLKKNDYDNKFSSLRICYGVLVKLYRNDHLFDKAMEMSKLQEQAVREVGPDDIPGERIRDLNYVYGLRASLLAEAGRFQEADIAYEQWKKTNPGNPYDEHEILSYLLMTKRLDEGLSVAERYKNYLRAEGDSVNIRMLDALTYESHIYSLFDDYKRAYDNYAPMASIAYQLHQLSSRKETSLAERCWLTASLFPLASKCGGLGPKTGMYAWEPMSMDNLLSTQPL